MYFGVFGNLIGWKYGVCVYIFKLIEIYKFFIDYIKKIEEL